MKDYQIFTDSCSDLGKDLREKYEISYVKMNIIMQGKELPASLDWEMCTPREMYDVMRGGDRVTTTQVPAEEFVSAFSAVAESGRDVLYIGCSSALSGSVNTGFVVSKQLAQKYPDTRFVCIDSLNSCMGEGSITVEAAKLRQAGKTLDETAQWVEENKLNFLQYATTDSLEYLRKAGRVKASSAFFGNLFGVKPIIISDAKGQNYAIKKVKGRAGSMQELVSMLKADVIDPESQCLYIGHADCLEDGEKLRDMVIKEVPCKETYINYIGPIIGASVGPGTVVVYCIGKKMEVIGG